MALEDYCAACTYLTDTGWCECKGENHNGSDPRCSSFCEAYSRSNSARKNLYDYTPSSGPPCYLTTIMCSILGYPDNNYYLNTLRKFRDNVMQQNPEYIPLLVTYDIIGPTIAYELNNDKNREEIAAACFDRFIIKAVGAIEEGKEKEAINIYKAMTDTLAKSYVTHMTTIDVSTMSYDKEFLGHARVRKFNFSK